MKEGPLSKDVLDIFAECNRESVKAELPQLRDEVKEFIIALRGSFQHLPADKRRIVFRALLLAKSAHQTLDGENKAQKEAILRQIGIYRPIVTAYRDTVTLIGDGSANEFCLFFQDEFESHIGRCLVKGNEPKAGTEEFVRNVYFAANLSVAYYIVDLNKRGDEYFPPNALSAPHCDLAPIADFEAHSDLLLWSKVVGPSYHRQLVRIGKSRTSATWDMYFTPEVYGRIGELRRKHAEAKTPKYIAAITSVILEEFFGGVGIDESTIRDRVQRHLDEKNKAPTGSKFYFCDL